MGPLTWVCLIVGIVGDATNRTLGLEPTNWFILAGISLLGAIWSWITSYFADLPPIAIPPVRSPVLL